MVYDELILTFVRHGETVANKSRVTQGSQPGQLTNLGRAQALRASEALLRDLPDTNLILCSDLLRVRQTADAALTSPGTKDIPRIPEVILDARLREKAGGVYEGLPYGAQGKVVCLKKKIVVCFIKPHPCYA